MILLTFFLTIMLLCSCNITAMNTGNPQTQQTSTAETPGETADETKKTESLLQLDKDFSILNDRLYIKMPDGTQDIPRQENIISAPESDQSETRLIWEKGDQKLVVLTDETFLMAGDSLIEDAKYFLNSWGENNISNFSLTNTTTENGLEIVSIFPKVYDEYSETISVASAYIRHPDGSIIFMNFYLNPAAFTEKDSYIQLAEDILSTLKPGKREIGTTPTTAELFGDISIDIDKGYVLVEQQGIDFFAYYIYKIVKVEEPQSTICIYIGEHPFLSPVDLNSTNQLSIVIDKVLGKNIEFVGIPGEKDDTFYMWNALFSPFDNAMQMHIFFSTNSDESFSENMTIIKSMRFAS